MFLIVYILFFIVISVNLFNKEGFKCLEKYYLFGFVIFIIKEI